MKFDQLQKIVHYIYYGVINVTEEELGAFYNVAKSLQIKGFLEPGIVLSLRNLIDDFEDQ